MKALSFRSAAALILVTSTAFAASPTRTARDRVNLCALGVLDGPGKSLQQCLKLHAPLVKGANLTKVAKCIENTSNTESTDETVDSPSWNKCVRGRAK